MVFMDIAAGAAGGEGVPDGRHGHLRHPPHRRGLQRSWHGKLATCILYAVIFIHIVWYGVPAGTSALLTAPGGGGDFAEPDAIYPGEPPQAGAALMGQSGREN